MKNDFVSKGRSVSNLKAHLVLCTKYRRSFFTAKTIDRMHEILEDLLDKWDCRVVEFNGEKDHIHLLFQYHPDLEISKLVNNIKTVTSRRLRNEFGEELSRIYGGQKVLWSGSYFIASCGGVTVSKLREYIENQDTRED
ncbi:MAG: IS200/IS605 family transposase [Cyanobacteria bacterium J06639_18]